MDRFGIYPGPEEARLERQAQAIAQAVVQQLQPRLTPMPAHLVQRGPGSGDFWDRTQRRYDRRRKASAT